jgi:CspA family cold shock protein
MQGTVIFFSNAKGWGFLKPEDGGPDIFCHHTSINQHGYRSLKEGQRVSWDVEVGPKGKPQAIFVTPVED